MRLLKLVLLLWSTVSVALAGPIDTVVTRRGEDGVERGGTSRTGSRGERAEGHYSTQCVDCDGGVDSVDSVDSVDDDGEEHRKPKGIPGRWIKEICQLCETEYGAAGETRGRCSTCDACPSVRERAREHSKRQFINEAQVVEAQPECPAVIQKFASWAKYTEEVGRDIAAGYRVASQQFMDLAHDHELNYAIEMATVTAKGLAEMFKHSNDHRKRAAPLLV